MFVFYAVCQSQTIDVDKGRRKKIISYGTARNALTPFFSICILKDAEWSKTYVFMKEKKTLVQKEK